MKGSVASKSASAAELSSFEASMVGLCISVASAFSLPKSIGAIYGLAYASAEPLTMDDFVERLQIAAGSASQGLRFLHRLGAVKTVYRADSRKTLYAPEESLRRVLVGVLNENFVPQLRDTAERLPALRAELASVAEQESREVLEKRIENLESWASKSSNLLPWLGRFISAPLKKEE